MTSLSGIGKSPTLTLQATPRATTRRATTDRDGAPVDPRPKRTSQRTARGAARCGGRAGAGRREGSATVIGSELRDPAAADEGDEDRRAEQGGHDADLELAGPDDHAADDVGDRRRIGADEHRVRQEPPVVGAGDDPDDVGHREADEPDRPGGRGGAAAQQDDRQRRAMRPDPADALAERAGDVLAERQAVERRPEASASTMPTTRNGSDRATTRGRVRPATRPPRSGTGRASPTSSRSIAEVNDASSADMAAPAIASFTGVAPPRPIAPST